MAPQASTELRLSNPNSGEGSALKILIIPPANTGGPKGHVVIACSNPFLEQAAFYQFPKQAMVRPPGFEPGHEAWEATILPLDHGRFRNRNDG